MEAVPHADRSGPEWGGDGELSKRFIELMKRLGDIGHQFRLGLAAIEQSNVMSNKRAASLTCPTLIAAAIASVCRAAGPVGVLKRVAPAEAAVAPGIGHALPRGDSLQIGRAHG